MHTTTCKTALSRLSRTALAAVLAAALCPLPAHAAPKAAPESPVTPAASADEPVEGELIVVYRDGAEVIDIADDGDVDIASQVELSTDAVDGRDISLVELADGQDEEAAMAALESDPRVESVERNVRLHAFETKVNDPYASSTYSYYLGTEKFRKAWDYARAAGSVTVAVLDTGVTMDPAYRNADLAPAVDFADAWDVTGGGAGRPLSPGYIDYLGHGTAIASLVSAAADNGAGLAGVSYGAKVLPVRVMDDEATTSAAELVKAYDYVISKAAELNVKVVNISLGGTYSNAMKSLQAVIDAAYGKHGILTVAAAGNESSSVREYPASLDHVVSVGSVDKKGKVAPWSEHNDAVDIVAAGVNVYVPSEWENTTTFGRGGEAVETHSYNPGSFAAASGTSFSAPIVAGAAALVYAAKPSATPAEVEAVLTSHAVDRGKAGRDDYYGHGELDAGAAVASVAQVPQQGKPASGQGGQSEVNTNAVDRVEGQVLSITSITGARKAFTAAWSGMKDASGYEVSWRLTTSSKWSAKTVNSRTMRTTVPGLVQGKAYKVRVRYYVGDGSGRTWGSYSVERTVNVK